MFEMFYSLLTLVGFYTLACYLFDNLRSPALLLYSKVKKTFSSKSEKSLTERYGKWAVITGSTDGIGKQYARALARKGVNVVLVSRTEAKLKAVAKEIETQFNVEAKIIVADFSKGQEIYAHIAKELDNIPVGILVNNVGQNTTLPDVMFTFPIEELWHLINTNIGAVTHLSHYFVRRMYSAGIRGVIVNIGSGTYLQPVVYNAVYAATKAYIHSLTLALKSEASRYGITFQMVSPNLVVTKMHTNSERIMRGGLFIPDAETYALWAVETIGKVDETTGYFWHGVHTAVWKLFSFRLRYFITILICNYALPHLSAKQNIPTQF